MKNKMIIDINNIKNPNILKRLSKAELENLCKDIRNQIIETVSKNGGHLSSNLGVVESIVALCKVFDFTKDKIIFDVGHQCYTYKILTGRNLKTLRVKNGISGFPKRSESPFDHYETGHSSTSLSAASGLAVARDLKDEKYDIIAFIGDGSLANGLALEALNNLKKEGHKIIIVVNINQMAISPCEGKISEKFDIIQDKNTKEICNLFGFETSKIIDGHNIIELEKAYEEAKNKKETSIILIKTIKGKGYSFAEKDNSGLWHGVGPFNIKTGEPFIDFKNTWSFHYQNIIKDEMSKNEKIVSIVPGTSWGSFLTPIKNQFPDRFFDVGIAEEHALTFASGLSLGGFHPVITIYSTFLQRAYDQIIHDLARMDCSSTLLIDRCGVIGEDGETHQGIYDEQFLLGIPNVVVAMASNLSMANALFKQSLDFKGVFAIRYPKENIPTNIKNITRTYTFGKWIYETKFDSNKVIIAFGPCINELKPICEKLHITLINAIYQKPLDIEILKEILSYKKIIIYNPYGIKEGFVNTCIAMLADLKYKNDIVPITIQDILVPHMSINQQKEFLHITIDDVIKNI